MKKALCLLAIFAASTRCWGLELGEYGMLNVNVDSGLAKTDVAGNTASSFARAGYFNTTDLGMFYVKDFEAAYIKSWLAMRYTNDPTLQGDQAFELQRFTAEGGNAFGKVILGDYFAEMSRYTLGTQGRGVFGSVRWQGFSVKPFAARTVAAREDVQPARYAVGTRVDYEGSRVFNAGLNLVYSADDPGSLNEAPPQVPMLRNTVCSLNVVSELSRTIKVEGEAALSKHLDETLSGDWLDGSAFFIKSLFNGSGFRGTAEYEWAGSHFYSLAGFVNTDRQTFKGMVQTMLTENLRLFAQFDRYNDNLSGEKNATLVSYIPKLGCEYSDREMSVNYSVKYIDRDDVATVSNYNVVNTLDGTYSLGFLKTDMVYECSIYQDRKNGTNSYTTHYANANLKAPLTLMPGWLFHPGVGGSWNAELIQYLDNTDSKAGMNSTRTGKVFFTMGVSNWGELGGVYSISDSQRVRLENLGKQQAALSLAVYFDEQKSTQLKAEYSSLNITTASGQGNYNETRYTASAHVAF